MGPLLFTYPITGTSWLIVISKGASHFYYDTTTRTSVWQFGETGVDSLANRVNFDDLAVLFGKSNGLKLVTREPKKAKSEPETPQISTVPSERGESDESPEPEVQAVVDALIADTAESPQPSSEEEPVEESESEPQQTAGPIGLSLGYSSDLEEEEEEGDEDGDEEDDAELHGKESGAKEASQESEGTKEFAKEPGGKATGSKESGDEESDVNEGLDLGFESDGDSASAHADFLELLELHKNEISAHDPWFLVEEELLPRFAQNPAFYAVDSNTKERLFEQWIADRAKVEQSGPELYPTDTLRYFQFLQEHKSDVRKLYFPDFRTRHAQDYDRVVGALSNIDPETLYRKLRVTLNDFADFERKNKKRSDGNMKVQHVKEFLRGKLAGAERSGPPPPGSHFDQWMSICNQCQLPQRVVEDPRNFILGDEKRLGCYMRELEKQNK